MLQNDIRNLREQMAQKNRQDQVNRALAKIDRILGPCKDVEDAFEMHFQINNSDSQHELDAYCSKSGTRPLGALEKFANAADVTFSKLLIEGTNYDDNRYMLIAYDTYDLCKQCAVLIQVVKYSNLEKMFY